MTRLLVAVIAVVAISVGGLSAQGVKKVSLEGEWDILAMSKHGKAAPPEALGEALIRITGTILVPVIKSTSAEDAKSKMTYQLVSPKDVNFFEVKERIGVVGALPPIQVLKPGIYELTGDTLKIAWSEDIPGVKDKKGKIIVQAQQAKRPTDFKGGFGQFTMTLKRKAK